LGFYRQTGLLGAFAARVFVARVPGDASKGPRDTGGDGTVKIEGELRQRHWVARKQRSSSGE
jgi:hypothetical protein